ncbi:hypothetical protein Calow_0304 [Caldicellulosiruptor owensensis OL]|uniref:Uracil-DNA glycosylase-like domain-containing protein n=1 Tax=Caldicellulosiruptor owensensis (strain ATCC 700167 / DSM 13100 / OL) TaxID=632518 RepID=E4Q367_CALOW|nr:hypothetical protein [Caldicellulosiruptor owensensis]ADQ03903.1 hypothetical protein Calow_0304 [Caldicellulosiruptor owensensis OL]
MINEQIKKLNEKFHIDGKFISGGVLDENRFKSSKNKMLVILKEVNDPNSAYNWTLPGLLNDIKQGKIFFDKRFRLWKNVCRWALVTENINLNYQDIDESKLKEALNMFAVINLKKEAGSGSSNYDDIFNHAEKYKNEWLEEIKIINPHLIVCGGTFDIIREVLKINNIMTCDSGAKYFLKDERVFLKFPHPAYQVSDKMLFAYFKETINALKKQCLLN